MKASDLLVRCLESEGVTHVFGVPGEENADLMLSLEDSSIEFVLTRHEQRAAFMAEVYGRLTGNPAACLATLGPGASNLITGVADANMDRAPLLAITGQAATDRHHKESHQVMDVVGMYTPVTKWSYSIDLPETVPEIVRKAVRLSRAEKPGAVAASLVRSHRKIVAITGDGDFLMNVQEMETARRLYADITVMVWVDGGYGLISWKQQAECGRSTDLSFGNPDWLELAASFGWHGQYVERSADLTPALRAALDHHGPSLLALPIDYRENLKLGERLGRLQSTL